MLSPWNHRIEPVKEPEGLERDFVPFAVGFAIGAALGTAVGILAGAHAAKKKTFPYQTSASPEDVQIGRAHV